MMSNTPDDIHKVPVFAGEITAANFTFLDKIGVTISGEGDEHNIFWDCVETQGLGATGHVAEWP